MQVDLSIALQQIVLVFRVSCRIVFRTISFRCNYILALLLEHLVFFLLAVRHVGCVQELTLREWVLTRQDALILLCLQQVVH